MGECIWFFFLQKTLLSGLTHLTPKYDIGLQELGKEPLHWLVYSRVRNKYTPMLINFLTFFPGATALFQTP
jgi:hypothetical protein